MDKKLVIKKYENRRLYNITNSKYVNLDEVARAIQDGYDVQVLDASTGEDITRVVLTQIITECAKAPDSVFPLDILREMVIASGKATQESALNYTRAVADLYKNAWQGLSRTMSPFEVMQQMMNSTPGQQNPQTASAAAPQATDEPQASKAERINQETELKDLKRRLQELESMIPKESKASSPPKKKSRARAKS